jgi:3-methyladenine DNA glycosylase Tag
MNWLDIKPADDYETLRKQFGSLKTLAWSFEQQLNVYRREEHKNYLAKLQLDSERAVNEILTNEIDILHSKIKILERGKPGA